MGIVRVPAFDRAGRMRAGCSVYVLLCQDSESDPVHAKFGFTASPIQRLASLRQTCSIQPRHFRWFNVWSRRRAMDVEAALHGALARWVTKGEWFRVELSEKREFNAAIHAVIHLHRAPGWDLKWHKIDVKPIEQQTRLRRLWSSALANVKT